MSGHEEQNWYYASANGERLGPVSIRELSSLAGKGLVGPHDLVWNPEYPDWIPAEKIADLLSSARTTSPPVLNPSGVPASGEEDLTRSIARENTAPDAASTATPASSTSTQELKPRKGSFVFPRILISMLVAGAIGAAVAGVLSLMEKSPWPGLAVFLAGAALGVFASLVAYRKERYQIHDARLLCHRGGLVSDQTTELEIRNITHVKLRLPWLRFRLFGIGNVIISTAGNARPVVMRAIREPEAVYAGVRARMKRNGYDLTQTELLHEEQPAIRGILGECVGLVVGVVMTTLFLLPALVAAQDEMKHSRPEFLVPGLLGLAVLVLVTFVIVRFLDFRRRTYRVFGDVVVYEEGFLTRENAFIPYENLADANTKRSLFDRIFGLYDVQVSCQGSGKEIKFRHLRRGEALSAAIDQLVALARGKPKPGESRESGDAAKSRPRRTEPEPLPVSETLTGDFRMNPTRTLVPLLVLLPLFPLWIAAMIQAVIRLMSTQYAVRPGSIRSSFRFITVNEREFAYDKITGLVIKQNLWDRMFGTMTLRFWSIGSGQPIEFSHVHANQLDLPALMRQAGIPAASLDPYEAPASFGLSAWLRARLKFLPILLLMAAGIVVAATQVDPVLYFLLALPAIIAAGDGIHAALYCSRQRLRFHDHHVEAQQGMIAKRRYYARYRNIKRTTATRYPGGGEGDLEIFVAGEEEIQQGLQQQKGRQRILKPCSFTTRFLPAVRDTGLLLDDILCGRVEPAPQAVAAEPSEVLLEARRAVGNTVVKLVLLSIVLVPLVVLLPVTLPFMFVAVKRWRYRIEAARIVLSRGILYRSETSILLDRVDSLQQSQGPLNKMFRNGNVTIMTAGSSKPDLVLPDSPAYLELYRVIREHSR